MSFVLRCPNCGDRSVYEFRFGERYGKDLRPMPVMMPFYTMRLYKKERRWGPVGVVVPPEQLGEWSRQIATR